MLNQSKAAVVELEENASRSQMHHDGLLSERVELYMKMQNLEAQLSEVSTKKDNYEKQLASLLHIPNRLDEISSQVRFQGVWDVKCCVQAVLM